MLQTPFSAILKSSQIRVAMSWKYLVLLLAIRFLAIGSVREQKSQSFALEIRCLEQKAFVSSQSTGLQSIFLMALSKNKKLITISRMTFKFWIFFVCIIKFKIKSISLHTLDLIYEILNNIEINYFIACNFFVVVVFFNKSVFDGLFENETSQVTLFFIKQLNN